MSIEKNSSIPPYIEIHDALWLCGLDQQRRDHPHDYWYTITSGSYSHTAFHSHWDLLRWLSERGLRLPEPLPKKGTFKSMRIEGSYHLASYLDVQAFVAIQPLLKIAQLSNGQFTLGKVTEQDGVRTIHFLNPNVRERVEFPYDDICWYEHYYQDQEFPDDDVVEELTDEVLDRMLAREDKYRLTVIQQMIEEVPDTFPRAVLRLLAEKEHYHRGWELYYRRAAQGMKSLVDKMSDYVLTKATCECGPEEKHRCDCCALLDTANQLDKRYPLP